MKKVALITGGTRGIGLGIARELAHLGCDLALNGVREEKKVQAALEELRESGSQVIYCQGNITISSDRTRILNAVQEQFQFLNILVNNAGIAPKERKDVLETTESSFDLVMDTNLKGPFFLTQAVANKMIGQKRRDPDLNCQIINISSISATVASSTRGEYCISKSGMTMMTKLFAARLGEYQIPVFEIRPGIIETDMTREVQTKYEKLFQEGLAVQSRWGYPEDVGKAVSAIVSGGFPYSTGQVFTVDGGLTLLRL